MVPRTFISLAMLRAADDAGVEDADACTTVSTPAASITLATSGFRMSTRAKSAAPILALAAGSGSAASTPMTRSTIGCSASRPASADPMYLVTPVTSTIRPAIDVAPLLMNVMLSGPENYLLAGLATGHSGLAQQLAVLLLGHPLATLLDDRTHEGDLSRCGAAVAVSPPRRQVNASGPVTAASPTDCRTRVILPAAPSPAVRAKAGATSAHRTRPT